MSVKMDLSALLLSVITNAPAAVELLPVNATVIDGARQNDRRPAWLRFGVPDGWAVNLLKNEKLVDGYILCRVDREFINAFSLARGEAANESTKENSREDTGSWIEPVATAIPIQEEETDNIHAGIHAGSGDAHSVGGEGAPGMGGGDVSVQSEKHIRRPVGRPRKIQD